MALLRLETASAISFLTFCLVHSVLSRACEHRVRNFEKKNGTCRDFQTAGVGVYSTNISEQLLRECAHDCLQEMDCSGFLIDHHNSSHLGCWLQWRECDALEGSGNDFAFNRDNREPVANYTPLEIKNYIRTNKTCTGELLLLQNQNSANDSSGGRDVCDGMGSGHVCPGTNYCALSWTAKQCLHQCERETDCSTFSVGYFSNGAPACCLWRQPGCSDASVMPETGALETVTYERLEEKYRLPGYLADSRLCSAKSAKYVQCNWTDSACGTYEWIQEECQKQCSEDCRAIQFNRTGMVLARTPVNIRAFVYCEACTSSLSSIDGVIQYHRLESIPNDDTLVYNVCDTTTTETTLTSTTIERTTSIVTTETNPTTSMTKTTDNRGNITTEPKNGTFLDHRLPPIDYSLLAVIMSICVVIVLTVIVIMIILICLQSKRKTKQQTGTDIGAEGITSFKSGQFGSSIRAYDDVTMSVDFPSEPPYESSETFVPVNGRSAVYYVNADDERPAIVNDQPELGWTSWIRDESHGHDDHT